MSRWFTYIIFEDIEIKRLIDCIIMLSNPNEKNTAHVTIAGPRENKDGDLSEAKSVLIGRPLSVLGVGKFFSDKQNTVYLRCDSRNLTRFWRKSDYGYNPHITIYDGPSQKEAQAIYDVLEGNRMFFELIIGDVVSEESKPGQFAFDLMLESDVIEIAHSLGRNMTTQKIRSLPFWERLMIVQRVCPKITWKAGYSKFM